MATLAELLSTHHGKHVLPALQRTVLLCRICFEHSISDTVLLVHACLSRICAIVAVSVATNQSSIGFKKLHC